MFNLRILITAPPIAAGLAAIDGNRWTDPLYAAALAEIIAVLWLLSLAAVLSARSFFSVRS